MTINSVPVINWGKDTEDIILSGQRSSRSRKGLEQTREEKDEEEEGTTCLQPWCCGFPSVFVPSFLQMEGSVRLHGLSSQRLPCASTRHKWEERAQLFRIHKLRRFTGSRIKAPALWGSVYGCVDSLRPRWRHNLLECCRSCWVQTGARR